MTSLNAWEKMHVEMFLVRSKAVIYTAFSLI